MAIALNPFISPNLSPSSPSAPVATPLTAAASPANPANAITPIQPAYTSANNDPLRNMSPAVLSLGVNDQLQQQLAIKSEAARKAALAKTGASQAQLSMSASTQSLFGFLQGGSLDALIQ